MDDASGPKFHPGHLLATPAALEVIAAAGQRPGDFLGRHLLGDWGELGAEDRRLNDEAIRDGSRLLSCYATARGVRLWVITEAADDRGRRAATTLLLPDEY
jgi:hypothetical protein